MVHPRAVGARHTQPTDRSGFVFSLISGDGKCDRELSRHIELRRSIAQSLIISPSRNRSGVNPKYRVVNGLSIVPILFVAGESPYI